MAMITESTSRSARSRFEGVKRVLRFNWPLYAVSLVVIVILVSLAVVFAGENQVVGAVCILAAAVAAWQTVASLIASHWVYDRSGLHHWQWLRPVCENPRSIVAVYAGYDESDGALTSVFPEAKLALVDFYDSLKGREHSIQVARRLFPVRDEPVSRSISGWPIADGEADLVFMGFSAHEIRDAPGRDQLFDEVARILAPDGVVVLIEHVRNVPNFVAFGPGALHFWPRSEWLRCASSAGLEVKKELCFTPLVGVFLLCR